VDVDAANSWDVTYTSGASSHVVLVQHGGVAYLIWDYASGDHASADQAMQQLTDSWQWT
jgi:hypothetical protein